MSARPIPQRGALGYGACMTLRVENLTCERGGRLIIDDLSFTLSAGCALTVKGPNGVGKSTLLRAMAGLLPCGGAVQFHDISLVDKDAWQSQVLYFGHQDAIKPQLSVRENMVFWAALFGGQVEEAAETFQLADIWNRPAYSCSAGQKRRLGLARLLVAKRPIWLLDEPTVSLDSEVTKVLGDVMAAHLARNGVIVAATHILLGLPETETLEMMKPVPSATPRDPFLGEGWE